MKVNRIPLPAHAVVYRTSQLFIISNVHGIVSSEYRDVEVG